MQYIYCWNFHIEDVFQTRDKEVDMSRVAREFVWVIYVQLSTCHEINEDNENDYFARVELFNKY